MCLDNKYICVCVCVIYYILISTQGEYIVKGVWWGMGNCAVIFIHIHTHNYIRIKRSLLQSVARTDAHIVRTREHTTAARTSTETHTDHLRALNPRGVPAAYSARVHHQSLYILYIL